MKLGYRMIIAIGLGLIASRPMGAQRDANLEVAVSVLPTAAVRVPALNGFTVCVGTEAQRDLYGQRSTGTNGATSRFIGLPRGSAVITVKKAGYTGTQVPVSLVSSYTTSGVSSATRVSVRMSPGSGGPSCPLVPVMTIPPAPPTLDATPIIAAPPTPTSSINPIGRPDRLGEETLAFHGVHGPGEVVLDCRRFGTNFVMIAITGTHGRAVNAIGLLCAPLEVSGNLSRAFKEIGKSGGNDGTSFDVRECDSGEAVTGISGTQVATGATELRSLHLHCRPLNAAGLASGTVSTRLAHVGSKVGSVAWALDQCTRNRPARALRLATGLFDQNRLSFFATPETIIAGVQLICEQPVRPGQ